MLGLLNDNLTLIKDGQEYTGLKASVQGNDIYVALPKTTINEGNILKRKILDDEELFLVQESNYYEKIQGIPSHYQIKTKKINSIDDINKFVEKEKIEPMKSEEQKTHTTINIGVLNSTNAQVGNHNTMTTNNEEIENKISNLINEIKKQSFPQNEEQEYLEIVEEVKEQIKKEKPKKTILKSLISTLPNLGDISSIGSMIIALIKDENDN